LSAARYEVLSTLPPGAGTRTRLAWQVGDLGFRRAVVMREVPEGAEIAASPMTVEGVLPLLDLVEFDGRRWAVYEFVAGATFAEVAAAHFSVERLPSLGLIARVVIDACRATHRVHTWADPLGLVGPQKHGGLSDAAVFVGFDGVARVLDQNARRLSRFIAPELTRGEVFDARADVFSLGALLHHATTRFEKGYAVTLARAPSPSEFPPPSTVHPEATPELDGAVMRALMPSSGSRYATTLELAEDLEQLLGPVVFSAQQVSTVLIPLFGDRMAALKDLVDPAKRPPAPKPSVPRAPPRASPLPPPVGQRKTGTAMEAVSAFDVKLDGNGFDDLVDLPTQANISLPPGLFKPGPPVAEAAPDFDPHATGPGKGAPSAPDFDPNATTPGRSLAEVAPGLAATLNLPTPSRPSGVKKGLTEDEKARAKGQEKISTADLDPDQLSPDLKAVQRAFGPPALGEGEEEPTNVRQRPSQLALAALQAPEEPTGGYDDPKKREPTMDVDPNESREEGDDEPIDPNQGKALKVAAAVFVGLLLLSGVVVAAVPSLRSAVKARFSAPPPPSTVQELPFEEVPLVEEDAGVVAEAVVEVVEPAAATDAGEEEEEGDGGEEEEEAVPLLSSDGGVHDGGAEKHSAATHKKKKKKRNR